MALSAGQPRFRIIATRLPGRSSVFMWFCCGAGHESWLVTVGDETRGPFPDVLAALEALR
jgi:hypothetical protein